MEFKDAIESARQKLELQLESAMPCKSVTGRGDLLRKFRHSKGKILGIRIDTWAVLQGEGGGNDPDGVLSSPAQEGCSGRTVAPEGTSGGSPTQTSVQ